MSEQTNESTAPDQGDAPGDEGLVAFLKDTWLWWLTPLVLALLLLVALLYFAEDDAVSPFIYDQF